MVRRFVAEGASRGGGIVSLMPVDALDIEPRTCGRAPRVVEVDFVRELGEADLALLASGRGVKPPTLEKLRDRHHALARCLALSMKDAEASAVTGYSLSRISILKGDPTFKQLMEHYRDVKNSGMADFVDRATQVSITALDILADRLEEDPNSVTVSQALEIVKTTADRSGHAPVNRQVNLSAHVDLGSRLANARARLERMTQQALPPPEEDAA